MVPSFSFYILVCRFLIILGNLLRHIQFIYCKQFLLYFCILSKTGVVFRSFANSVFVLYTVQLCPAVCLVSFISAAVILLQSLAVMVQFSKPITELGGLVHCIHFFFFSFQFSAV